jgi:hypothetical protein
LQHHLADADGSLDAAVAKRIAAGLFEAGLSEIAKAEQGAGGLAGAANMPSGANAAIGTLAPRRDDAGARPAAWCGPSEPSR